MPLEIFYRKICLIFFKFNLQEKSFLASQLRLSLQRKGILREDLVDEEEEEVRKNLII